jgi:hypothetical protein
METVVPIKRINKPFPLSMVTIAFNYYGKYVHFLKGLKLYFGQLVYGSVNIIY